MKPARSVDHRQQERPGRRWNTGRDQDDDGRRGNDNPAVEERGTHQRMLARKTLVPVGIQHMGLLTATEVHHCQAQSAWR